MEILDTCPHIILSKEMFFINLKKSGLLIGDWLVNQRGEVFQIMELAFCFRDDYFIKGLSPDFIFCPGDSYTPFNEIWNKKGKIVNLHYLDNLHDFCVERVKNLPKWEKKMEAIIDYGNANILLLDMYGDPIIRNKIIGIKVK